MKSMIAIALMTGALLMNSCTGKSGKTGTELEATQFQAKLKETPDAQLVDVRTPEEYSKGHLENSQNFDWNGDEFEKQIATLDKSKPVFVYCLSGGRSGQAAKKMRAEGFKEVYELSGGIMKWRAANLPETAGETGMSGGMSMDEFNKSLDNDKLVLVDFYADWCGPCQKMKPYLEEISSEMGDKMVLVRINADDNETVCRTLKIDALPTLHLYKNRELVWSNIGLVSKSEIQDQINSVK